MILTLSSQLAQCTVKIAATAEGEGGRVGWQSLKAGAVDTKGPAGRTVEHTQLAVKTHPYNADYANKQAHINYESGRIWPNPMVKEQSSAALQLEN